MVTLATPSSVDNLSTRLRSTKSVISSGACRSEVTASRITGSASLSFLMTRGSPAPSGRLARMRPMASRTSFAASSILRPISNSMTVRLRPRRLCEPMVLMPGTPAIELATSSVMSVSTICGDAPVYSVDTVTTAASTSGSSRTGIENNDAIPETTTSALATIARTGRRIDRSDRVIPRPPRHWRFRALAAASPGRAHRAAHRVPTTSPLARHGAPASLRAPSARRASPRPCPARCRR